MESVPEYLHRELLIFSHNRNAKTQQILPHLFVYEIFWLILVSFQLPISGVPITHFTTFRSIRQNYTYFSTKLPQKQKCLTFFCVRLPYIDAFSLLIKG